MVDDEQGAGGEKFEGRQTPAVKDFWRVEEKVVKDTRSQDVTVYRVTVSGCRGYVLYSVALEDSPHE